MVAIFGGGFNLANHMNIAKLNVRHLGCKHGLLSIQYSKLPIKITPIAFLEQITKYSTHQ